jgi:translation initiation factor IF-3
VRRFLEDGAKVRASIMFRGREMTHTELGLKLLDRLAEDMSELATVEAAPKVDGRNMVMVLAPLKAKPDGGPRTTAAAPERTDDAPTALTPAEPRPRPAPDARRPVREPGPRPPTLRPDEAPHAQAEDPQRRQEALPRHPQRQGDVAPEEPRPPARAQVPPQAPPRRRDRDRPPDAKKIKKLLNQ